MDGGSRIKLLPPFAFYFYIGLWFNGVAGTMHNASKSGDLIAIGFDEY
jgi:hypothetical protein